jgi:UDP-N-acetyl-2-amino-2-deoxyglucuronate dehydrogenase
MSSVRFAIIGCGPEALPMIQGISTAPNAAIVMLMDDRGDRLADLSELYAVPITADVKQVLATPEVDAVYISVPVNRRARLAIEAARAGKHILLDAPVAGSLEDADALIDACRRSGVHLGVTLSAQLDAALSAARDLVRAGMLGQVRAVHMNVPGHGPEATADLAQTLNTVRWVTGLEVESVYVEAVRTRMLADTTDGLGAVLRYDNGGVGLLQTGTAVCEDAPGDVSGPRIYGAQGQLILAATPLVCLQNPPEGGVPGAWQALRYSGTPGDHTRVAARYAAAVLEDRQPPVTAEDGRRVLAIALACRRSAELGGPVPLSPGD